MELLEILYQKLTRHGQVGENFVRIIHRLKLYQGLSTLSGRVQLTIAHMLPKTVDRSLLRLFHLMLLSSNSARLCSYLVCISLSRG